MGKESDHIHLLALAQALGVCVRITYLDRVCSNFIYVVDIVLFVSIPLILSHLKNIT